MNSDWDDELGDTWTGEGPEVLTYDGVERPWRAEDFIRRAPNGRPYVRKIDPKTGELTNAFCTMTRVTNFIKGVDDQGTLFKWYLEKVLLGFAQRPRQFSAEVMQWQDSRQKLLGLAERIKDIGWGEDAALIGTAVHALTERHDLNLPIKIIPEYFQEDLTAWVLETRHYRMVEIERFMVNDMLGTGGTPDRIIAYHACAICGRKKYVLDLKTGRVDEYTELEIAMQLAIYGNSDFYDMTTGIRTPHDDICRDKAIVIHLPAGSGQAMSQWVDIGLGWEIVTEVAVRMREARRHRGLLMPFEPVGDLHALIEGAQSAGDLRRIWSDHRGIWIDEHNKHASRKLQSLS
jgi:hypothetical protein